MSVGLCGAVLWQAKRSSPGRVSVFSGTQESFVPSTRASHYLTPAGSTILLLPACLPRRYDATVLALQWPTTRINTQAHAAKLATAYASAMAKHQVASSWTIHGFWPTRAAGPSGSPSYCGADSNLTYSQARCMDGIIPTVNYYWPDLAAGRPVATNGSTGLWEHEWAKHGSCYGSTYFIDATLVTAGLNLTEVLLEGGIAPSATQPYHGELAFKGGWAYYNSKELMVPGSVMAVCW